MPGATTVVCLIALNLEPFAEVNSQLPVILDTLSSVQMSSVVLRAGYCAISGLQCWNLHREAQRKSLAEEASEELLAEVRCMRA